MDGGISILLESRLRGVLPARAAQEPRAVEMSFGRHFGPTLHNARRAAVMVLLFQSADQWRIPLMVRPPQALHHASQVSLPGGAIEPGETADQAALRELKEELGVPSAQVQILGAMSPLYVFASNHYVEPFVGLLSGEPNFELNSLEVARLLEVPLHFLLEPANVRLTERLERGVLLRTPAYDWSNESIWGATCMILAEFAAIVRGDD